MLNRNTSEALLWEDILPYLQEAWSLFLLFGSLTGWIAGLSLAYTWRANRLRLKIHIDYLRVQKSQGRIDVGVRVKNRSPRRHTSIESIYLANTTTGKGFFSEKALWLVEASSILERRGELVRDAGRNIRIQADGTTSFDLQFPRPTPDQYLPRLRIEGPWRRYRPFKLIVETTHRTFAVPVKIPMGVHGVLGWWTRNML